MTSTISDAQVEAALTAYRKEAFYAGDSIAMHAALTAAAQAGKRHTDRYVPCPTCGFVIRKVERTPFVIEDDLEGERVEPPMPAADEVTASLSADESLRRHGEPSPEQPTDTSDAECAVACMLVANPRVRVGDDGWQRRVNDLIRALRDDRNELRAKLSKALDELSYADLRASGGISEAAPDTLGLADDWQLVPKRPTNEMLQASVDATYNIGRWPQTTGEVHELRYQAMLAAAPSYPSDGWQLVPKEPATEMIKAGDKAGGSATGVPQQFPVTESVWRAMLAAAPSHPQPQQHDGADVQGEPSAPAQSGDGDCAEIAQIRSEHLQRLDALDELTMERNQLRSAARDYLLEPTDENTKALAKIIGWIEHEQKPTKLTDDSYSAGLRSIAKRYSSHGDEIIAKIIDGAADRIATLTQALAEAKANTSMSVSVGGGLAVYGSAAAISRLQNYILLDSTHPVEKGDVRRSLMRNLQKAEAALAEAKKVIAPFAEIAMDLIDGLKDDAKNTMHWAVPTVGHLRAARAFAEQQGWGVK